MKAARVKGSWRKILNRKVSDAGNDFAGQTDVHLLSN